MKANQLSMILAGTLFIALPLIAGGQKSGTATPSTGKPLKPVATQSTTKTMKKEEAAATGEKTSATQSKESVTTHKSTSSKSTKHGQEVHKSEAPMKEVSKSDEKAAGQKKEAGTSTHEVKSGAPSKDATKDATSSKTETFKQSASKHHAASSKSATSVPAKKGTGGQK